MRPREILDRLSARPEPDKYGEQLEEHIHGEEPSEVVRERHAEVASALLPDPLVLDGRLPWIDSHVPHDHHECSDERNCEGKEGAGRAADFSDQQVADPPGEVAGREI